MEQKKFQVLFGDESLQSYQKRCQWLKDQCEQIQEHLQVIEKMAAKFGVMTYESVDKLKTSREQRIEAAGAI